MDTVQRLLERLLERREAWELYERFFSSLHFTKQATKLPDPGYYPAEAASLHTTLRQHLGIG